jgi:uncharacterized membrane protein YqaE (UPF0057 family)
MKLITTFKSLAIIATVSLFLASCSGTRYGYIDRASTGKKSAPVAKETPAKAEAVETVNTPSSLNAIASSDYTVKAGETKPFSAYKVISQADEKIVKDPAVAKAVKAAAKTFKAPAAVAAPIMKALAKKAASSDVPVWLLYVLCLVFPPLAVGLVTDWDWEIVVYNILWCALCGLPGIIHAFIVVARES